VLAKAMPRVESAPDRHHRGHCGPWKDSREMVAEIRAPRIASRAIGSPPGPEVIHGQIRPDTNKPGIIHRFAGGRFRGNAPRGRTAPTTGHDAVAISEAVGGTWLRTKDLVVTHRPVSAGEAQGWHRRRQAPCSPSPERLNVPPVDIPEVEAGHGRNVKQGVPPSV